MKIALICDDLIQRGGAEKVFMGACEIWPDAHVYTSVINRYWKSELKKRNLPFTTSFLQRIPFSSKLNRLYSMFLLHVRAFESFDLSSYDMVISFSARYAHFVITKPSTLHICYMHSPGRMFWEPFDYFEKETFGLLRPFKRFLISCGSVFLSAIRLMDYAAAQRVDHFISNSETTKARIKKYYGRDSELIHPFVNIERSNFSESGSVSGEYFLIVSRLASWKKIDIAIKACSDLGLPLKIAGEGPAYKEYKDLSKGSTVEVLGFVTEQEKHDLIRRCKALIHTQKEDFGIVPLEVMSYGKPVLAYGQGGACETVVSGVTGEFFNEQTSDSLKKVLTEFDPLKYYPQNCINRASEFGFEEFKDKLSTFTNVVYLKHHSL